MCEIDITIIFVNKQHCCRCRLKSVVARSTTHLKHCHETKFRCCKLKQQVEVGSTFFNNKICCVIMFEVGDNTCNNAFQFATQQCCVQIAAICCSYYFTLLLQLKTTKQFATTKFGCVTMFEVGGNTCNNAFQLATQQCCVQVDEKCCPYYRAYSALFLRPRVSELWRRLVYLELRTTRIKRAPPATMAWRKVRPLPSLWLKGVWDGGYKIFFSPVKF